jgi:hypothetical protein
MNAIWDLENESSWLEVHGIRTRVICDMKVMAEVAVAPKYQDCRELDRSGLVVSSKVLEGEE